jgi:hypothetical protein
LSQGARDAERQTSRLSVDDLITFENDVRELHYLMTDLANPRGPYWSSPTLEDRKRREAEAERQRLLRLSGRYRRTVDRVIGNEHVIWERSDPDRRPVGTIWDLALGNLLPGLEAEALGRLADRVSSAIGMIEGDPSLLDPPTRPEARSNHASALPPITIVGDGNVLTLSGRDSVVKRVQTGVGRAELGKVLDELKAALADLGEDDEDVKDRHQAVDRLGEHLTKEKPEARPINRTWERIVAFATVEGAIQGGERIKDALLAVWPYVEPWVDGPPSHMLPGAQT